MFDVEVLKVIFLNLILQYLKNVATICKSWVTELSLSMTIIKGSPRSFHWVFCIFIIDMLFYS